MQTSVVVLQDADLVTAILISGRGQRVCSFYKFHGVLKKLDIGILTAGKS